jgi:hypothetical protein
MLDEKERIDTRIEIARWREEGIGDGWERGSSQGKLSRKPGRILRHSVVDVDVDEEAFLRRLRLSPQDG